MDEEYCTSGVDLCLVPSVERNLKFKLFYSMGARQAAVPHPDIFSCGIKEILSVATSNPFIVGFASSLFVLGGFEPVFVLVDGQS